MKNILTLIFLISLRLNCVAQINPDKIIRNWIEVGSNDPYNGPTLFLADTLGYRSTIRFASEGKYFEKDNWNDAEGEWKWNSDTTKIGFSYVTFNKKRYPRQSISDYRLLIYKLTNDSLIIGQQGIHGISKKYYIPTSDL